MGQNKQLLDEYKQQLNILKQKCKEINANNEELDFKNLYCNRMAYYDPKYYSYLASIEQKMSNQEWYKFNLQYAIKWMELGHEPEVYNGIENRFKAGESSE